MTEIPKDQSGRKAQIAILETQIAKHAAAIHEMEINTRRMIEKQIHRLAELRFQRMMLKRAEDFAAHQQRLTAAQPETLQPETCNS